MAQAATEMTLPSSLISMRTLPQNPRFTFGQAVPELVLTLDVTLTLILIQTLSRCDSNICAGNVHRGLPGGLGCEGQIAVA